MSDYKLPESKGDVLPLTSGHFPTLGEHPRGDWNNLWVLLEKRFSPRLPRQLPRHAVGRALPPALERLKSKVLGSQTAIVTGPAGEEIHCDQYGHVKVQFHWDRDGQSDDKTTCWLGVASGWAGAAYGGIAIPRIGMEVLVTFLEGDPDQPSRLLPEKLCPHPNYSSSGATPLLKNY